MFKRIKKFIAKINSISKKMIVHGLQLACGVAVIGLVCQYNAQTLAQWQTALAILTTSIVIFGESLIFGFAANQITTL
jgi:hypothetical protein